MKSDYKPINCNYYDYLEEASTRREYVQLMYFSDIHELLTARGILKKIETTLDKEEYVHLNTGEKIRLDRIVRLNDIAFPGHQGEDDFSCHC
jgi:Rho-binding antiterminator